MQLWCAFVAIGLSSAAGGVSKFQKTTDEVFRRDDLTHKKAAKAQYVNVDAPINEVFVVEPREVEPFPGEHDSCAPCQRCERRMFTRLQFARRPVNADGVTKPVDRPGADG